MLAPVHCAAGKELGDVCFVFTKVLREIIQKFENETIWLHFFDAATILVRWIVALIHSDFIA